MTRILPFIIALMCTALTHAAGVGTAFTYQAQLTDAGQPYVGSVDLSCRLYDAALAGTPLGDQLDISGLVLTDGLITLDLDFGVGVFDGNERWLEIDVNGTTLVPRQPLMPAPYAIFALNAVDPEVAGLTMYPNGAVGVGTHTATETVDQENLGAVGLFANVDALGVWQSFTAGLDGPLTGIAPNIASNSDGILNVYAGTGTGGALLASTPFSLGSGSTYIPMPAPVGVTAGSVYTIELLATGATFRWYGDNGNPYPGGQSSPDPDVDFHFQTFVTLDRGGLLVQSSGDVNILGRLALARLSTDHPIHVGTDSLNGNGAHLTTGGMWTNGSDRNSKTNFETLNAHDILDKVLALPVTAWQYHGEPESVRHIGPMAQDFHAAFGLGESDRHIGTIDADGVALVAIQALHEMVNEKDAEIDALTQRIADLERLVEKLAHQGVE